MKSWHIGRPDPSGWPPALILVFGAILALTLGGLAVVVFVAAAMGAQL